MTRLACPCGSTRLRSDEVASILYPVTLTRAADGAVEVDYPGVEGYEVVDEGTVYVGDLWCRDCGKQITEDQLVPAEEDGAPCCPDPGCPRNPCTFPGYADNH